MYNELLGIAEIDPDEDSLDMVSLILSVVVFFKEIIFVIMSACVL